MMGEIRDHTMCFMGMMPNWEEKSIKFTIVSRMSTLLGKLLPFWVLLGIIVIFH